MHIQNQYSFSRAYLGNSKYNNYYSNSKLTFTDKLIDKCVGQFNSALYLSAPHVRDVSTSPSEKENVSPEYTREEELRFLSKDLLNEINCSEESQELRVRTPLVDSQNTLHFRLEDNKKDFIFPDYGWYKIN